MALISQSNVPFSKKSYLDAAEIFKVWCQKLRKCSPITADNPSGLQFSSPACRRHNNAIPLEQTAIVASIRPLGQALRADWCATNYDLAVIGANSPTIKNGFPANLISIRPLAVSTLPLWFWRMLYMWNSHLAVISYVFIDAQYNVRVFALLTLFSVRTAAVHDVQYDTVVGHAQHFRWSFLLLARTYEVFVTYMFTLSVMWYLGLSRSERKQQHFYVRFSMSNPHWIPIQRIPLISDFLTFPRACQNREDQIVSVRSVVSRRNTTISAEPIPFFSLLTWFSIIIIWI